MTGPIMKPRGALVQEGPPQVGVPHPEASDTPTARERKPRGVHMIVLCIVSGWLGGGLASIALWTAITGGRWTTILSLIPQVMATIAIVTGGIAGIYWMSQGEARPSDRSGT